LTSAFDLTASSFERHRAFPAGMPEAIRTAILNCLRRKKVRRILDLGAGTGRIGEAFVQAGDAYVGVDLSLPMLREFAAHSPAACLIQADGRRLSFSDRSFDLVLLMQVLSGMQDPQRLLVEALRVVALHGAVIAGQTVAPDSGVDKKMKRHLNLVLKEMGMAMHEPKKSRETALSWLEARASHRAHVTAARWTAERTPQQFIARHRTGARFASLPAAAQEQALGKLGAWAEKTFSSLEQKFVEEHSFELDVFEIGQLGN
jgi:ubiquinone/menaquinone biosynthesis C-methylase UbiE